MAPSQLIRGPARPLLLGGTILGISLLHYLTGTQNMLLHQIYQRLYYIPVVAGSLWYGITGGILTSLLSGALYFPHILHAWAANPVYRWNQYSEILIIVLVGVITGMLSTTEKRQRRHLERAMEDLSAAYERLQRAFDELKRSERMSMLGQLAAGIAHEIRNPLGSIQGAIEILESGDQARRHEFAGIVKKEIERLNSLINDFLNFARPRPLEFQLNSVNDVVKSLVQLVRKRAESQGVGVAETYGEIPSARIDSEQLKAALLNIVLNGIQAMPRGGTLHITTSVTESAIRITVADQGIGIPEEARERLFEPFFSTRKDGTGLGLAAAEQTIRNHGGALRLASTGPTGTIFDIDLPIS